MDRGEQQRKKIEDFAYAVDLTLPVAREFTELLEKGVGLSGDERRCRDYVAKRVSDAVGNGEQWAKGFATALVNSMIDCPVCRAGG